MAGPDDYSIQVQEALQIVAVSRAEGDELDRRAAAIGAELDAAAAAAGAPVAAALAELRARHDEVTAGDRGLVQRAADRTTAAVAAYDAADGEMARQYGPFPVEPARPLRPEYVDALQEAGEQLLPLPPFLPR